MHILAQLHEVMVVTSCNACEEHAVGPHKVLTLTGVGQQLNWAIFGCHLS